MIYPRGRRRSMIFKGREVLELSADPTTLLPLGSAQARQLACITHGKRSTVAVPLTRVLQRTIKRARVRQTVNASPPRFLYASAPAKSTTPTIVAKALPAAAAASLKTPVPLSASAVRSTKTDGVKLPTTGDKLAISAPRWSTTRSPRTRVPRRNRSSTFRPTPRSDVRVPSSLARRLLVGGLTLVVVQSHQRYYAQQLESGAAANASAHADILAARASLQSC
ncbi:hypothetical protein EXIGLDRAFT_846014 [Exidia glandulosa HHB12029]|uniref:Uncharacterized protein n=1 Tax=Exidia glandulosa HHB12029 TaxID=1314781 RepID=A0A165B6R1_EXIGL|nr:hypothetical protein EXIGLDRAFT_846014 [Exidia glandulosa HHB12029]